MACGTAGAVFDAISRQKEADRVAATGHMGRIKARLALSRMMAEDDATSPYESFDCYHVCGGCGYLSEGPCERCPSCGDDEVIDLKHHNHARILQEHEAAERQRLPQGLLMGLWGAGAVAAGSLYGVGFLAAPGVFAKPFAGAPVLFGLVVTSVFLGGAWLAYLARKRVYRWWLARQEQPVMRWRKPLGGPDAQAAAMASSRGLTAPQEALLTAPLSRRPCVAYHLAVRFQDPSSPRPWCWAIDEHKAIDMEVGDATVSGASLTIDRPLMPVPEGQLGKHREVLEQVLRQRGLFLEDGEFEVYETVILPHEQCTLTWHGQPDASGPTLS